MLVLDVFGEGMPVAWAIIEETQLWLLSFLNYRKDPLQEFCWFMSHYTKQYFGKEYLKLKRQLNYYNYAGYADNACRKGCTKGSHCDYTSTI